MSAGLEQAVRALGFAPARALKRDIVSEVWVLEGPEGKAILKRSNLGPGRWLTLGLLPRLLASREQRILRVLEGVSGVPRVLASVDGRTFIRGHVDGVRLRDVETVPAGYFPALVASLEEIHRRGVACIDLSKRENLLVTTDGLPALIDFQASAYLRPGGLGAFLFGWFLRMLQRGDIHHVYKHHRRHFPSNPIPEPTAALTRGTLWARLHGTFLRRPYVAVKRLFFGRTKG